MNSFYLPSCVSKMPETIDVEWEKVHFDSEFQRFHSMGTWALFWTAAAQWIDLSWYSFWGCPLSNMKTSFHQGPPTELGDVTTHSLTLSDLSSSQLHSQCSGRGIFLILNRHSMSASASVLLDMVSIWTSRGWLFPLIWVSVLKSAWALVTLFHGFHSALRPFPQMVTRVYFLVVHQLKFHHSRKRAPGNRNYLGFCIPASESCLANIKPWESVSGIS